MSLDNSAVVPALPTGYDIDQSLRINSADSPYLSWTPSSTSTSKKTFTLSVWVKLGNLKTGSDSFIWSGQNVSGTKNCDLTFKTYSGEYYFQIEHYGNSVANSSALRRDVSGWYHIVAVFDTTQATSTNRIKMYVNGEQVSLSGTFPTQNLEFDIGNTHKQMFGALNIGGSGQRFFDGHLAEVNFIDGQALDHTSFGETDEDYGHWKPIRYTGSYGTNGYYLDFDGTYYNDKSGNGNNFTATNLATTDVVLDSPTNNFATMSPLTLEDLQYSGTWTFSEGNLKASGSSSRAKIGYSFAPLKSGKYYMEVRVNNNDKGAFGWMSSDSYHNNHGNTGGHWWHTYDDYIQRDSDETGSGSNYISPASINSGDIGGIAIDLDGNSITWYKNGTSLGSGTLYLTDYVFYMSDFSDSGSNTPNYTVNFGQDSTFAGVVTAGGNSDANGIGDFKYSVPSGYLALCTANLSDPAVIPSEQFNTLLYTGSGSSGYSVTGVGFSPDLLWIKRRNADSTHCVSDSVRGDQRTLFPNLTLAEYYTTHRIDTLDADGFTFVGTDADVNSSGQPYVAWNWNASGSTSSNTNGTGITSTVDVNSDAGFSIATYTGTGSSGSTVGHGLSQTPEFVIIKQRSGTGHWAVWHKYFSTGTNIALSSNSRAFTVVNETSNGGISTVNSSVVSFQTGTGDVANVNVYDGTYVMYSWHSVDGYSKIGSYTGNGSSDGKFVYTGFRPMWVMLKRSDANGNWLLWDTKRKTYNVNNLTLLPNLGNADNTDSSVQMDILSNGFKIRGTNQDVNYNGGSFIYIAFAENPFKYTNAR